jgi:hypothetical protein
MQAPVGQCSEFVLNPLRDSKPMEVDQEWCDVVRLACRIDKPCR